MKHTDEEIEAAARRFEEWADNLDPATVRFKHSASSVPAGDFRAVTRFEVIDSSGRIVVRHGVIVAAHLQDDGTTLKIFLADRDDDPLIR